jgi:hypothetical protein
MNNSVRFVFDRRKRASILRLSCETFISSVRQTTCRASTINVVQYVEIPPLPHLPQVTTQSWYITTFLLTQDSRALELLESQVTFRKFVFIYLTICILMGCLRLKIELVVSFGHSNSFILCSLALLRSSVGLMGQA